MITVAWSLSYEFFYYLVAPLVIGILRLRRWSGCARFALIAGLAGIILGYPAAVAGHVRVALFLAGILVYETASAQRLRAMRMSGIVAVFVAFAAIGFGGAAVADGPLRYSLLFAAFGILCYCAFVDMRSPGSENLPVDAVPMARQHELFVLSHSWVDTQGCVGGLGPAVPPDGSSTIAFWAALPVAFAFSTLPALALFALIERPFSLDVRKPVEAARA